MKRLLFAMVSTLALVIVFTASFAQDAGTGATYVGHENCKKCHFKQYKSWKESKHATNFDVLPEDKKADPECVKCHVTGMGKPGGFVSLKDTPGMVGTQCEACHGPGSKHVEVAKANEGAEEGSPKKAETKASIKKNPGDACVGCHNPHVSHKEFAKKG